MRKIIFLLICFWVGGISDLLAEKPVVLVRQVKEETLKTKPKKPKEAKKQKNEDGIRKGWTFGILPSVAFDPDLGFQYGLLSNIYYFGDGSQYPEYLHSFYVEAAYTTKRYGLFRFCYDSKFLIPKHRLTVDLSYLPDEMCDFTGYNGYQSVYNYKWGDPKSKEYISRAFYKHKRSLFRVAADIQGPIAGNWFWNAGIGVLGYSIGNVNLNMINKGKKKDDLLPTDVEGM
ncbi:MAG: hypothetical protein RR034_07165, partial [Bacteroidales bacterium]